MSLDLRARALQLYEEALHVPPNKDLGRRSGKRGQLKRLVKLVVQGDTPQPRPSPTSSVKSSTSSLASSFSDAKGSGPSSPFSDAKTKSGLSTLSEIKEGGGSPGSKKALAKELDQEEDHDDDDDDIRGRLCSLRLFCSEDLPCLVKHANDRAVSKFLRNRFPCPYTAEAAQSWIDSRERDEAPFAHLAIVCGGECCGGLGLDLNDDGEVDARTAEIGYWIGRQFAGRGIMTEALGLYLEHVWTNFVQLETLTATIFAANAASVRVLEKNGFLNCGNIPRYYFKNDSFHDATIFCKNRNR